MKTIHKRRVKHNPAYLAETERIKENAKKYGSKVHKFKAAEWTHPNGHPRCLLCGQEESISPECNREPTKAEHEAFSAKLRAEFGPLSKANFNPSERRGRGGKWIDVFHGTTDAAAKAIDTKGITASKDLGIVHVTTDEALAHHYARERVARDSGLIELAPMVVHAKVPANKLSPGWFSSRGHMNHQGSIPAKHIVSIYEADEIKKAEHVPGTPYRYRHGWIPVGSTGKMHGGSSSRRLRTRREPGSASLARTIAALPEETARQRRVARANAEQHGVARPQGAPAFRTTNPLGEAVSHGTPTEPKRGDSGPKRKTTRRGKPVIVSAKPRIIRNRKKVTTSQVARTELPGPAPYALRQEAEDYASQHYPKKEEKYAGLIIRLAKSGKAQDPSYRGQQSQKYGISAGRMIEIENEMHEIMYPTQQHHSEAASVRLADMPEVQRSAIRRHGGRSASVYPDGRTRLTKALKGEHKGKYVKLAGNGTLLGVVDDAQAKKDIADNAAHWKAQEQKAKTHPRRWIHEPIINAAGRPDWHSRLLSLPEWEKEKAKIEQGHADKKSQAKAIKEAKIRVAQQWAEANGYDPSDSYWWGYYWSDPSLIKDDESQHVEGLASSVFGQKGSHKPGTAPVIDPNILPATGPTPRQRRKGKKVELPAADIDQRDMRGHRPGPKRDIKRGEDLQQIANDAAKASSKPTSRQRRKIQKLDPFRYITKSDHQVEISKMPRGVAGHVYHFKHGWIPLSHPAAKEAKIGQKKENFWDHKNKVATKIKRLPHGAVHQPLGPDGKKIAKKNMTPEQALYARNNGATAISDKRLAEIHKNRSLVTPQERDLLMSAGAQKHLDGDRMVKGWVVRESQYKPRPRFSIIANLRKEIANDLYRAKKDNKKGSGGHVVRREDIPDKVRNDENEKRRDSGRNIWGTKKGRRIIAERFSEDGVNCTCIFCGQDVLNEVISPERMKPGGLGGEYELENMAPAHEDCNTLHGTKAQHDPQTYYEDMMRWFIKRYSKELRGTRLRDIHRKNRKALGPAPAVTSRAKRRKAA